MGIKSFIEKRFQEVKESGDERVRKAEEGKFFGSDQYSRYLSNATGATTWARRLRALKGGGYKNDGLDDIKNDMRIMRPTIAYSAATHAQEDIPIAEEAARTAALNRLALAEQRKERLGKDVRARRARRSDLPGNKNGTLLTGSLGLSGDASTKLGA